MYDRVWDGIGDVARLAPTPHNTQPFRIVPRGPRNADLVVVRDRLLPREDHGNLYMAAAFGKAYTIHLVAKDAKGKVSQLDIPFSG